MNIMKDDYFFTLKPETWKIDLKKELERKIKQKKVTYNKEIKIFKNKINDLIKNSDVDILINDML